MSLGSKNVRRIDESLSSSPKPSKPIKTRRSRPSTGRNARTGRCSSKTSAKTKKHSLEHSSEERSPDRSAIVAVIDSPVWDEDEKEIGKTLGKDDTGQEDDETGGVTRVLPSTSEEELAHASTPSTGLIVSGTSGLDFLPRVN